MTEQIASQIVECALEYDNIQFPVIGNGCISEIKFAGIYSCIIDDDIINLSGIPVFPVYLYFCGYGFTVSQTFQCIVRIERVAFQYPVDKFCFFTLLELFIFG